MRRLISQTRHYGVLVFLRCVQASGISPVIAINSGIVGDVCKPQNRGGFVGIVQGMFMVGQAFGSLMGSAHISRWSWRAIFVFLAIGLGVKFLLLLLLLTETARHIVENGSIWRPWVYRTPVLYTPGFSRLMNNAKSTREQRKRIDLLAPAKAFRSFRMTAAILAAGIQYGVWNMALTTFFTALETSYGYSTLHTGVLYLPQGL